MPEPGYPGKQPNIDHVPKFPSSIQGAKMKCEHEMSNMSHDLDEMAAEAALSEEKAQRAMIDAARLAGESCWPIDDLK